MIPSFSFDAPEVLDCAVTAIPASGSSPLQVVSSTPSAARRMHVIDSIGEIFELMAGAPGAERRIWVFGNTGPGVPLNIEPGTRLSVRSLSNAQITEGKLCCVFFGS